MHFYGGQSLHSVDLKPFQTLRYSLKPLAGFVFAADRSLPPVTWLVENKHQAKESEMPYSQRVEPVCHQTLDIHLKSDLWTYCGLMLNQMMLLILIATEGEKAAERKGMIKRQLSPPFHWFTTQPQAFLILYKGLGKTLEDYWTIHSYTCLLQAKFHWRHSKYLALYLISWPII